MISDPSALAATVSAALLTGVAVGAILTGLANRGRAADDAERAGRAFRELRDLARACADPVHLARLMRGAGDIWDNLRPDGLALDVTAPAPLTPEYAHRLVDAYATGQPLNFAGCWVPPDIQGRLRAIITAARPATTASRPATGGPITQPTPPLSVGGLLIRPRTSDG
ncbi:hypothetical protein [Micromonospora sp. RTP1Z1]|uniref:hypothetical protein n=1 Tax=Micromonospora sp. RTP1Z1 TaxID=2994043 RepID=UPI0029C8EBCA|nr:hypothetical protein [Micromonospora sp. RTP1Z1]